MTEKYFGKSVTYLPAERDEAINHLNLWKKYILRSLERDSIEEIEVIDEQWGEQPEWIVGSLSQHARIYLKLRIEFKFIDELR